ncbi:hypothetical protein GQ42DRAFT_160532 [Ramicandelaber brevisporus]|nr:hypothetical protein GQ42DRAFT_160532 [Ramicandelaber brevisporus]
MAQPGRTQSRSAAFQAGHPSSIPVTAIESNTDDHRSRLPEDSAHEAIETTYEALLRLESHSTQPHADSGGGNGSSSGGGNTAMPSAGGETEAMAQFTMTIPVTRGDLRTPEQQQRVRERINLLSPTRPKVVLTGATRTGKTALRIAVFDKKSQLDVNQSTPTTHPQIHGYGVYLPITVVEYPSQYTGCPAEKYTNMAFRVAHGKPLSHEPKFTNINTTTTANNTTTPSSPVESVLDNRIQQLRVSEAGSAPQSPISNNHSRRASSSAQSISSPRQSRQLLNQQQHQRSSNSPSPSLNDEGHPMRALYDQYQRLYSGNNASATGADDNGLLGIDKTKHRLYQYAWEDAYNEIRAKVEKAIAEENERTEARTAAASGAPSPAATPQTRSAAASPRGESNASSPVNRFGNSPQNQHGILDDDMTANEIIVDLAPLTLMGRVSFMTLLDANNLSNATHHHPLTQLSNFISPANVINPTIDYTVVVAKSDMLSSRYVRDLVGRVDQDLLFRNTQNLRFNKQQIRVVPCTTRPVKSASDDADAVSAINAALDNLNPYRQQVKNLLNSFVSYMAVIGAALFDTSSSLCIGSEWARTPIERVGPVLGAFDTLNKLANISWSYPTVSGFPHHSLPQPSGLGRGLMGSIMANSASVHMTVYEMFPKMVLIIVSARPLNPVIMEANCRALATIVKSLFSMPQITPELDERERRLRQILQQQQQQQQ